MNIIPTKVVLVIRRICFAVVLVAGLGLTGCGTSTTSDGRIRVVASTNVWGEIAKEIGGDRVDVTSFISNPSTDPHSYEADAQNQLVIANAKLVIENGGGYDDFMGTMMTASGSKATVINTVKIASTAMERPCLGCGSVLNPRPVQVSNEHVWYDLRTVVQTAWTIEAALTATDPTHAATYKANEQAFTAKIYALWDTMATFRRAHPNPPSVGITEPVPVYLLNAMSIKVITPTTFSKAIEEGSGVPVLVMQQVQQQISNHQIKALVYNAQTSGPETSQVLATASTSHVPSVPVTETIPSGMTYVSWMTSQVGAIIKAVG